MPKQRQTQPRGASALVIKPHLHALTETCLHQCNVAVGGSAQARPDSAPVCGALARRAAPCGAACACCYTAARRPMTGLQLVVVTASCTRELTHNVLLVSRPWADSGGRRCAQAPAAWQRRQAGAAAGTRQCALLAPVSASLVALMAVAHAMEVPAAPPTQPAAQSRVDHSAPAAPRPAGRPGGCPPLQSARA